VEPDDVEIVALVRNVKELFSEVILASPTLPDDIAHMAAQVEDPSTLTDVVASASPFLDAEIRQGLLEELDVRRRLEKLTEALGHERDAVRVQNEIRSRVSGKLAEGQREMLLREQLEAIRKELGEEGPSPELAELRKRIERADLPDEVRKETDREMGRLEQIPAASPEYTVARTHLDWLLALPWKVSTGQRVDLRKAQAILDEDHFDLEKVKDRILEYLAVFERKPDSRGPIICFVGPPGVGKTSVGMSIARATGRRFARFSLGGIADEAEIRGHRRTYVGALPGQIIRALRRAESNDLVLMLDEVDKLGRDFRGDPAAALLEVLDPEQNVSFLDHYIDIPFDLSKVLFLTTANVLDTVPPALRDRMETIELPGYIDEEKLQIARQYLIPRQTERNGVEPDRDVAFDESGIRAIIEGYTREAGVRELERNVGAICRKRARQLGEGATGALRVDADVVRELLGPPRRRVETELAQRVAEPGVAVAVAWTPYGGDVLFVEATRMPRDQGQFVITGQVKEVMQESARIALSWVRGHAERLGIDPQVFAKSDLHIHVPAGAVPKDGPSAGLVMVVALVSLFRGEPVRPRVAMSGEITLSGQVLDIGGVKEKVLAAKRSGVQEIVLPEGNRDRVLEDIAPHLRAGLEFHFVRTIEAAVERAFATRQEPLTRVARPTMPS
jgi:ATP-dependent Lon protease